jgi:hypothetical protein
VAVFAASCMSLPLSWSSNKHAANRVPKDVCWWWHCDVQVQTLDVWGNATCPNDMLPFEVALQCAGTDPGSSTFQVDDR